MPRMWEVTVPSVGAGGCSEGGSGAGHCPCPAGDWGREDASHGTTQAEPRQGTDWSLVGSELPATRGMQAEALVGLLSTVPGRCWPAAGGGSQGQAVPAAPRLLQEACRSADDTS